mmetsp:Transcript_21581/g.33244  ORF Transcript_21581/g.33244 Transcript_21581/m.33244 type:complete len:98 (-) Transcript_21581:121-414(-)
MQFLNFSLLHQQLFLGGLQVRLMSPALFQQGFRDCFLVAMLGLQGALNLQLVLESSHLLLVVGIALGHHLGLSGYPTQAFFELADRVLQLFDDVVLL